MFKIPRVVERKETWHNAVTGRKRLWIFHRKRTPSKIIFRLMDYQAVPIKDPVRSLRMGLLTAQGADKSRTVKAFLDFSKEQAKSGAFEPIGGF